MRLSDYPGVVLSVALFSFSALAAHAFGDQKTKPDGGKSEGNPRGGPICAAQCAADIIADGFVNIDDLLAVINGWGVCVVCPPTYCSGDANHDCGTNIDDLLTVINGWGPCPAPSNDNCATFTILNTGADYQFCTAYATTDGPAEPGCAFCCGDPQIHKDVWYSFSTSIFAGNYWVQLDTCGADFDTKIAVYRFNGVNGCNCTLTGATLVACNDDAGLNGCNLQSRVQFQLSPSSCYRVRVGGYNGQSGSGVLHTRAYVNGDECFNAIDLGIVTSTNPLSVTARNDPGSNFTIGATVPQAPCTSFPDGRDVWYKFQIGCGGNVIGSANTCDPTTNFDTILALYRGTCDGLVLIDCNDDYTGNSACQLNGLYRKSLVSLPNAASAGYYYLRLSGYNGATGNYRINIGLSCIN